MVRKKYFLTSGSGESVVVEGFSRSFSRFNCLALFFLCWDNNIPHLMKVSHCYYSRTYKVVLVRLCVVLYIYWQGYPNKRVFTVLPSMCSFIALISISKAVFTNFKKPTPVDCLDPLLLCKRENCFHLPVQTYVSDRQSTIEAASILLLMLL